MNTGFQLLSPEQYSTLGKYGSAHVLLKTADSHAEDMPCSCANMAPGNRPRSLGDRLMLELCPDIETCSSIGMRGLVRKGTLK